ncbi:MAG TPA: calcium-binding protein [Mycobacteriales bacterium]|jgi:Ca2+-binding RTX toxin-like protein|nr:calcium-binding protein [Mycobacteriales bacterium]
MTYQIDVHAPGHKAPGGARRRGGAVLAAAAVASVLVGLSPAQAAPEAAPFFPADILIDFEQDTNGAVPNGFTSVDSPFVHFSDTVGADLLLGDLGVQGEGTRSLVVLPDDASALEIRLDRPTTKLSLRFGDDDPGFTAPGDEAVLTLFRGSNQVGEVRVTLNRNDVMDQTITAVDGSLFNRAVFSFDALSLPAEVVDHVLVGPLCTIAGSDGPDTLTGTPGNDVICGGAGNDTIRGLGGNDVIVGGNGADTISGGNGNDVIRGNFGADVIHGDAGDDRVEGREDNDRLFGDAGRDLLDGGSGRDRCDGGTQSDSFSAGCEVKVGLP